MTSIAASTRTSNGAEQTARADQSNPPRPLAAERPLRRDAARNRERILRAAADVFADRGLNVSLDDIAKHAGLGVGTVYRRFPTKEQLIEALFEDYVGKLAAMTDSAAGAENSWDGLVNVLTEVCAVQAGNRGLREVMMSTVARGCADRVRGRLMPVIEQAVRRAQDDGHLREDINPVDLVLIEFMIGGIADYTKQSPDAWRRYLEIIIAGLRARPDVAPCDTPALTSDELDDARECWQPPRRQASTG